MALAWRQTMIAVMVCVFPCLSLATVPTWQIIPEESSLGFVATQNNAPINGRFREFNGEIQFEANALDESHVRIEVMTGSVDTSFQDVEDALRTSDWFNTKMFPKAVFEASRFRQTGTDHYQAEGTLSIRDKTIPITLSFGAKQLSDTRAEAEGETTLSRTAFGVGQGEWSSTDEIKDTVQVVFSLAVVKK